MNRLTVVVLLALVGLFACQEKVDVEADVEVIEKMAKEWDVAFQAGDVDALTAMYTDDAVTMSQEQATITGKEAISAAFAKQLEENTYINQQAPSKEVFVCGDWAFQVGTYSDEFISKASEDTVKITGRWMAVLKRQPDGLWKYFREMSNSDTPPAEVQ